jgi:hypothetical protein
MLALNFRVNNARQLNSHNQVNPYSRLSPGDVEPGASPQEKCILTKTQSAEGAK